MKIITRGQIKDFYDYLQGILGQDELVVYDRRNCFPIDPTKKWDCGFRHEVPTICSDYKNSNIEKWFSKEIIYGDKKRTPIKRWNTKKVLEYRKNENETKDMGHSRKWKYEHEEMLEGQVYHFVLEVGYHHYYFEVERYIDDDDENRIHLNYGLIEHKRIEKDEKISSEPMCLAPISHEKYHWLFGEERFLTTNLTKEQHIDNPILFRTYIPKFIEAHEIWDNLYEYISSLRDKEFIDTRTNEQHIESNGFDKRISFRTRKKG